MLYTVVRPTILVLVVACAALLVPGVAQRPVATVILVGCEALMLVLAMLMASRGHVGAASSFTIVSFLGFTLIATALIGGLRCAVVSTILPSIVLAGALRGMRAAFWATGAMVLGVAILVWLEHLQWVPVLLPKVGVSGAMAVFVIAASLLLVFLSLFAGRLQQAHDQAESSAEEARASEGRLAAMLRDTPDGIVLMDQHGVLLECTPPVERMMGYSAQEMVGHQLLEQPWVTDDRTREILTDSWAKVLQAHQDIVDLPLIRKDGSPWDIQANAHLVGAGSSRPRVQVSLRDVTALREAERLRRSIEDRAREAERLETVGRLAGGVAHDFRNVLTAIFANADLLLQDDALSAAQRAEVDQVVVAAERANELTKQLLTFAGQQEQQPVVLDPAVVVHGLEGFLRRLLREDIAFQVSTTPGRVTIRADPTQLEQVVINLVVNARDAMPQGRRVVVEVSEVEVDEETAGRHPGARTGRYALLMVNDTGEGMAPETVERIFEPFFSTKPEQEGTGLGLATVHGIVTGAGGYLSVYSEPGQGTCFKAHFPRVDEDPVAIPEPASRLGSDEHPGALETVLLADDEVAVLRAVQRFLESSGYRVLVAENGDDAVARAQETDSLHLVVVDMVMPGPSGRELVARIRALHSEVKVVYVSGYTEDSVVSSGDLAPHERFLPKPFRLSWLLDTIAGLLRDP